MLVVVLLVNYCFDESSTIKIRLLLSICFLDKEYSNPYRSPYPLERETGVGQSLWRTQDVPSKPRVKWRDWREDRVYGIEGFRGSDLTYTFDMTCGKKKNDFV